MSRGLLHYYFGSKERLLVEVVRLDCDTRIAALEEALDAAVGRRDHRVARRSCCGPSSRRSQAPQAVLYEMISASRHSEEIRAELAELYDRWREHLADALRRKEQEGVVSLAADSEAVASLLFAIGDGLGLQLVRNRSGTAGRRSSSRPRRAPPARRRLTTPV